VLGVVEPQARALDDPPIASGGIGGEHLAQVESPDLVAVTLQRLPGGTLAEGQGSAGHRFPTVAEAYRPVARRS
jgi:hypothetical protein